MNRIINRILLCSILIACTGLLIVISGCSSGSGSDDSEHPQRISVPLEGALSDIQLYANQTAYVQTTLQVPSEVGVIESAEIDVAATLEHVQVSASTAAILKGLAAMKSGQPASQAFIRVGTDEETVCSQGIAYGPYPVDIGFWDNPSPESVELSNSTVQILNTGGILLCMELTTTFDVSFSIDQVEMDVIESDCGSPADFSGVWTGTYLCGTSCDTEPFGGAIELTITQNGTTATYTDSGGDFYQGTVCGNIFRFERHDQNEVERGILVLDSANHATKKSTYRGLSEPYCTGDCIDHLVRGGN